MNVFAKPVRPAEPRSNAARSIALLYAGMLTIFAVAQLFTFEEFYELIISFNTPLTTLSLAFIVPFLIACEVFALPFLLRMTVSPAFWLASMLSGLVVPFVWIVLSLAAINSYPAVVNVGFLGDAIGLTPGWWAVLLSVLLAVMAIWSSWGLRSSGRAAKKL